MAGLMKRVLVSAAMVGGLGSAVAAHAAPKADLKGTNVVLVHGAFADGSSWNRVIPLLEARGLHVVSVQNPLSSLADDAAATKRAIDGQKGPVVLVGHSWAGVVISEAGNDDKVKSLVYVAAFAPDSGQSIADVTQGLPAPAWAGELRKDAGGFATLSDQAIAQDFAPDLPPAQQHLVAATQGPWYGGCLSEKVAQAAWHAKPSTFVVTTQDRMIDPALQEAMAKRIGATVARVNGSHVAMLSRPTAVADAIIAAAERAQRDAR
ncbi:signal peptide protein [Burkholderia sp. MSh2]|uniref:Family S33 serine peptidase n=1 Tax=Burkholderia paludis TaxID=1506587 RepID=A0A6J5ERP9_9BURK|nr:MULTISPECIES: alpha/beta hydrolase [Burkholderia]KEZ06898.1 signal peptide protein [Burkholderia sp. MSh2]KFG97659.1 signal peptide protein [Burkholderia paludis]CAB3768614.1 Pyrethroid hydrolase [Burkholderia paludis]VWC33772.1 family S33 serine peptidase [Burkholderia paludis]